MGLIKGGCQRLTQTLIYLLAFATSAVILAIYAYFLSILADRDLPIDDRWKAVTGIAGGGALFTLIAVVLTCCLGGITFFGFIAIVLNIALIGGFIAIAILTRSATHSCDNNYLNSPLGFAATSGFNGEITYAVSPQTACRLNQAAFACSIIGAVFFLLAAIMQVFLIKSGKKDKRYGPSPDNNYTSGEGKKQSRAFWKKKGAQEQAQRDAEMGVAPVGAAPVGGLAAPAQDVRPSYETGTTVGNNAYAASNKVEGAHSGYYTQPQGTGVNPYGQTGTATNY